MKVLLGFFLFLSCFAIEETKPFHFRIREKKYVLSDEFEMDSDGNPFGMVRKSKIKFPGKTVYEIYSTKGEKEGYGITSFFCLGLFWSWGTEMYVYDTEGELVGWIDGQVMTTEAKFSFYHANGKRVGIAYLDEEDSSFSLKHPDNHFYTLAEFNRKFIQDVIDPWTINVYEPDKVDLRLLKTFAAFVVDRQNHFKIDK